jgi:heme/copper-type cytochrome/quinol oxidase subunit 4
MNTHAVTSSSSHGSVGRYAGRVGLSLLLAIGPIGAAMSGMAPRRLPLPAIVVLCVGLLLVQLVWFLHPAPRKGAAREPSHAGA